MNTRLAVASHILAFIEASEGQPASSEMIAESVNTNPTLVRRLLAQMNKAGLTKSQMGTTGGALLARKASQISLLDVYRAVDGVAVLALHEKPNPKCPVGRNIHGVLQETFSPAEAAFQARLAQTTVADMAVQINQLNGVSA